MRARWSIGVVVLGASCGLSERSDFLIGRSCEPELDQCDEAQVCLPHDFVGVTPADFRCRDAVSFEVFGGAEPPVAYCLPDRGLSCPEGIVCGAGRILSDEGARRPICRPPDSAFGPPETSGGS